ncbi:membrane alanyl aminopeptidase-like [Danaus plexippus]|uniref:membrane alanyl aminopeptidase-like n=1 Tax=Danaus plexippus TaxID=13037 RepID=UPI002AB06E10|nr:membrane alanyl aminopeptidase-like [Danaus plexippus]
MIWQTLLAVACIALQPVHSDTRYRLNTTIVPSAYSLTITPYFDTNDDRAFSFDGEVSITFVTTSNINKIKLHSQDLIYTSANITLKNGNNIIELNETNPLEFEEDYTFAHINLASDIQVGSEYTLNIVYQGPIRTDLNGFYRNYYFQNGVKKWLGATQMEPTHARKVFPCFDEPELKAVFTMSIDRPAEYQPSLTNTEIMSVTEMNNGYIRENFYPTPRMSTYLVAFLVSEFEAGSSNTLGANELGIYTRPDAKNQTEYAFDVAQRIVKALGDYFGIDYYSTNNHLRLDHVALTDFRAGAMENWGLIKYRESLLLYVPEESTPYFKYRVAQIVAHETTHMWFGNLVTCHWWSNTWLNEGFANYFQDYMTSLVEPDVAADDALVIGSVYSAYNADDNPDSPAITNNDVNSPSEISGHFGTITYQKAGSVIRMMHHLIGDDAFKYGLNSYLSTNQFQSGYPELLYSALENGVRNFTSLSNYEGFHFTDIMSSWIRQSGHPVLYVNVDYENSSIELSQKRFYINSSYSSDELYIIPITYTLESNFNFENTKPALIMDKKTHVLQMSEIKEKQTFPIFNIQETGLYRVNYDINTWHLISEHLKSNRSGDIHYLNRAKIVNDLFAFLFADEVKFELLHNLLHFLSNENEYAVWNAALKGLTKLRNYYIGSDTLDLIDEFALELLDGVIYRMGYDVKSTDDFKILRNRMQILEFACKLGHQGCIDRSLQWFKDLKNNDTWIQPSLRSVAYCTGLRYGNDEDYEFLWNRLVNTNVANEAWIIADVLGCSQREDKLKSYLVSMLLENSPIKTQDLTVPLASVLTNYSNVPLVMDELQSNISLWKSVYSSLGSVLSSIASSLHTQEDFEKFESFLSSCKECSEDEVASAKNSLAKARAVTAWADDHRSDILSSLSNDAVTASASIALLVVGALLILY